MDIKKTEQYVNQQWDDSAIPELVDYIRIPNKSPVFDADWQKNGHMQKAVNQFQQWCLKQDIPGLKLEIRQLSGRTPLIYIEIPGITDDTVLLYGHLDKQPEMTGWRDGLGPWQPVIQGDKLYGRGGADDGYALFASIIAIKALKQQELPHCRCIIIIEACEESGSFDLPHYITALTEQIGHPDLVICLDSGCGNYDQLWCTTSLRGLIGGKLTVEVLTEGVHSGDASGIVPSSFRIIRQLLERIENSDSGLISLPEFNTSIPESRIDQARQAGEILQQETYNRFPFAGTTGPVSDVALDLILNRTWRPALSITGADGLPLTDNAGNVLRPRTTLKLSLRLPPDCDADKASARLKQLLEQDPPYNASVEFVPDWNASGWHAPELQSWLESAIDMASRNFFDNKAVYMGEGGSIPFMGMLGEKFPQAQFLITGVLGPQANAHGPNEFLHIPTAKKLTCCVAQVIHQHYLTKA